MSDKIQKLLAHAGYGSRREIEKWINLGRITVNGKRAKLGDRATANDRLLLDGDLLHLSSQQKEMLKALIYHKPEGQICSRKDPKGRPTVFENLPDISNGRWVSVGRLDINTSGLLLFTNNGELANKLMHPSTEIEREYLVRIRGIVAEDVIRKLITKGVNLDGKPAKFESVVAADFAEEGTNHWYRVVIKEGRYREVRRIWETVGHTVSRLKRIRYGTVKLTRDVKLGQHVKMAPKQLEKLVSSAGLNELFEGQLYSGTQARSQPQKKNHSARQSTSKRASKGNNKRTQVRRKNAKNELAFKKK